MSRLPHRLAIAALVGMLVPVNAFADYRESFSQGIRAYRAENWRATAVLMQQALQEQPRETGRVQITGNDTVPYLPSFYLGDALLRQGDCAGALTAFERARNTPAANNRQLARPHGPGARDVRWTNAGAARSSSGRGSGYRTSRAGGRRSHDRTRPVEQGERARVRCRGDRRGQRRHLRRRCEPEWRRDPARQSPADERHPGGQGSRESRHNRRRAVQGGGSPG